MGDRPAESSPTAPADRAIDGETMRRVIVSAEHRAEVHLVPIPRPGPREALVRMVAAGVCGSDTHALHGRHPFIALPYAPGHEVLGVVTELGADVATTRGLAVGTRVTVEPTLPCWRCKQCLAGRQNLCENLAFFGCGYTQGGMADLFTIPADRLHVVPDGLDDTHAVLIEPLSTPVHAVRLAGPLSGRSVAVLGAGTIGLMVLLVALRHGAARVVVTDVLPAKRSRALALGAYAVIDAAAPDVVEQVRLALGESADVVFDCVAVQQTVTQAIGMALKAGTVVVVGVPAAEVTVPLPVLQDQQVRLQGSATYLPEDFADSIELLRSGAVRARDLVTATFGLDDVDQAFAASIAGEQVKVLVTAAGRG